MNKGVEEDPKRNKEPLWALVSQMGAGKACKSTIKGKNKGARAIGEVSAHAFIFCASHFCAFFFFLLLPNLSTLPTSPCTASITCILFLLLVIISRTHTHSLSLSHAPQYYTFGYTLGQHSIKKIPHDVSPHESRQGWLPCCPPSHGKLKTTMTTH